MLTRILTALPLIAGFLAALFLAPALVWLGIMALILFLGALEWGGLARLDRPAAYLYAGLLTLLGLGLANQTGDVGWIYWASLVFWLLVPAVLWRELALRNVPMLLGLGFLVLVPTFLAILQLRTQSPGLLLAVVGLVVMADSAAYFCGRRFGRSKLAPRISPGKTREGALGAWLGVSLYALILHTLWPQALAAGWPGVLLAAWSLFVLSVLGDLLESWIKRQAGVKDSGTLLPGHGGVLDRIDSLTATLPTACLIHSWMS
ncbi:MAG TPA: phosphatidate cytidylyltransferase [Thiobacillaceae bacterium]|nr:phosphatidate cytidylyltransferase [Thiobacillaceae bacterium]HNU64976.1 phosphatidate cytidylyltransferase [Thiobacillaceae bacterium]